MSQPRRRDRRGRGVRGPHVRPGPLTPRGVPWSRSRAERFDLLALDVVEEVIERWPELDDVDVAVEDVPVIGRDWRGDQAPLGSLVPVADAGATARGRHRVRARLVLFRRPLEHRAESREDLADLVLLVTCDQLAPLLGCRPEDVHPDYPEPLD